MKAKTKTGDNLLDVNKWDFDNKMMINFKAKGTFDGFYQDENHLMICTLWARPIDIVFTGETPTLAFESYDKDQLILKVI